MYHLRLCKGLSYYSMDGKITATRQQPDIYTEDKAVADAAVASGFFVLAGEGDSFPPPGELPGHFDPNQVKSALLAAIEDELEDEQSQEVTGRLDPEKLESMTIPDLKKLAGEMGVDIKGCKDKAAIIKAICAAGVNAPAFDAEALAAMSDEELKALVEKKGIDLTGCQTREDALEAISVALGGSYTMLDLMRE